VSAMEAKSSASTLTGVSFEKPGVAVEAAGGVAVELTVSAMEATVSVIDASPLASTSTGASLEEP